jgi:hypothetical protein
VTALVSVETVLVVILVVLVAGLLRSHAEILRRLGPDDVAAPQERRPSDTHAVAISGQTLDGDPVKLDFEGGAGAPTLLAFLSSGCSVCHGFWQGLGEARLPASVQTLIVTQAANRESPSRLRELAPDGVPVVMSKTAWKDYAIPGAPYFVLVDSAIRGEGAASSWEALASLLRDAIEDARIGSDSGPDRARRIDDRLAAAGIAPDDPSLRPGDD